jgi:RNA 2',3'-cyclic 3'-phosphodiesterase
MGHRVFIAINLPERIKNKLAEYQSKWPELPCRWTKKENLHITLEFLGYLTDEELMEVCQKTDKMASEKKSFVVCLNKICYGPGDKKPIKMVWATGERIKELSINPHITLGRLRTWQFRQMEPEQRPEINEDIDLSFEVNSIEIMESRLKRGGPEYTILQSCRLIER